MIFPESILPTLIQTKSGIFYIVSSVGGKRVWRSTKTRDRRQAYRVFLQTEQNVPSTKSGTLSQRSAECVEHVKATYGTKTFEIYELSLRHLREFTGDVLLEQITARTIDLYKIHRLRQVSPSTVNIELRTIKAFFNCMQRWEVVAKNPCDGVTPVRVPQQLPPFLTMEQLDTFVREMKDPWLRRITLFAAMTGARIGEILGLTWDRVDLNKRVAVIQSSPTFRVKGGRVRTIPLNHTAMDVLLGLEHRDGLVFRGKRGGPANPNHVSGHFRKAARMGGLDKKLHFHSLRHTFASLLVQAGVSLYQVQKLLGHSSARVTEVYAHLQNQQMHDIVDVIGLTPARGTNVDKTPPPGIGGSIHQSAQEAT